MRSKSSFQFRRHLRTVAREDSRSRAIAGRGRRHLRIGTNLNGDGAAELAVLVDRWSDLG